MTGQDCAPRALIRVILLAALLAAPAASAGPSADETKIRDLETRFAVAVAGKNLDALMSIYAPKVQVFDVTPPRQYDGAAAYREDWKAVFAGFAGPIQFQITDLVISAEGNLAFSHSIQHLAGAGPGGAPIDFTVRVTDVYRKEAGAWRIVHEHVSVPVDLATAKADLESKP